MADVQELEPGLAGYPPRALSAFFLIEGTIQGAEKSYPVFDSSVFILLLD